MKKILRVSKKYVKHFTRYVKTYDEAGKNI